MAAAASKLRGLLSRFSSAVGSAVKRKPKIPPSPKVTPAQYARTKTITRKGTGWMRGRVESERPIPYRPPAARRLAAPRASGRGAPPVSVGKEAATKDKLGLGSIGPGTAFVGGMTAAELISAVGGAKDAVTGGGGGVHSGPSPDSVSAYGDAALRSQRLADKTALKIARLEARTRLRLAKIQRTRDLAMAYLSNPVIGIGVAYATIVGVRTALELGRQYGDYRTSMTMAPGALMDKPILTMAGITGLSGSTIPAWNDIPGGLYNAAAQGGAFGLLPEMAQLAGLK